MNFFIAILELSNLHFYFDVHPFLVNTTVMQENLGLFKSTEGQVYRAYWEPKTGRLYMKMERSSLRTSFIEMGNAQSADAARLMMEERLGAALPTWQ